ncbi:MAG: sigma factor-like helix-turn-helix DNA-binding protein [Actinomycetota bacterium]
MNDAPDDIERSYAAQADRLWRSLVLFSGDREIANDAVSEAFAQAIARGSSIHDLDRWVWRAAFKIARGDLKRRARQGADVPDLAEPPAEVPIETVDLLRALATLSPKQRASVVLHHYAGYSTRETARAIGSTAGAVGMHLDRGRRRLRELLGDEHDEPG